MYLSYVCSQEKCLKQYFQICASWIHLFFECIFLEYIILECIFRANYSIYIEHITGPLLKWNWIFYSVFIYKLHCTMYSSSLLIYSSYVHTSLIYMTNHYYSYSSYYSSLCDSLFCDSLFNRTQWVIHSLDIWKYIIFLLQVNHKMSNFPESFSKRIPKENF